MSEKTPEEEALEAWDKGAPVEVKRIRPSTSVLSIRLPLEVFHEISARAEAQDISVSAFGRELIERALTTDAPTTVPELAAVFQRWVAEIASTTRSAPQASLGITRQSWAHFYVASAIEGHSQQRLWTDVRVGRVPDPVTDPVGERVA